MILGLITRAEIPQSKPLDHYIASVETAHECSPKGRNRSWVYLYTPDLIIENSLLLPFFLFSQRGEGGRQQSEAYSCPLDECASAHTEWQSTRL